MNLEKIKNYKYIFDNNKICFSFKTNKGDSIVDDSFFKTIEKVHDDTDNNRYEYCDHFVCMMYQTHHDDDEDNYDYNDDKATTINDYNDYNVYNR